MSNLLTQPSALISGPMGVIEVAGTPASPGAPYSDTGAAAIVCHPHPLHGGTMNNKVVTTLARAYRDLGIGALRFNFRGVGHSEGKHDNAIGEVEDLVAVASALLTENPNTPLLLAGFSFGSSIAAQASYRLPCLHLSLIAPPVPRYVFERAGKFLAPVCIVQGDDDERVEEPAVRSWAGELSGDVQYHCFVGAGHFFHGRLTELKQVIAKALIDQLPPEELLQ
ncbi:alpha/beta hydrolase [Gilvimarinus sp. SDUM040013]|uniref:Alpha/beta hydrolase n=1 Tax=Gilvimarinus gilvus TaxID=3058038 RepID=A0ABU4RSM6_9GAMM|nr:alpha/beta family hydrolase [Gilvimarinus sp. SDUM040013]MDO3388335.1 alpha/beta hydrolase [Gilvimarinus sp. SDUM040013]MDX6847885.1 alpha/beta hydrolase [Gilvimarinus sp. SDUM040013]